MVQNLSPSYVGVDVAKARLDVAVDEAGETWTAHNEAMGIDRTVARLQTLQPALVVVESTGGLERPLVVALYTAGVPVALVNPGRVKGFAKAIGLLAKTDKLDARLLARFAAAVKPAPLQLPSEAEQHLSALMSRRHQILEMLTAEKNRLHTIPTSMRERLENHIVWLEQEVDDLNTAIQNVISHQPDFRKRTPSCRVCLALARSRRPSSWLTCRNWAT